MSESEGAALAALYRRAIEVVAVDGWIQGGRAAPPWPQGAPATRGASMLGALWVAHGGERDELLVAAERGLLAAIGEHDWLPSIGAGEDHVVWILLDAWNDMAGLTVERVVEALGRAAAAAESGVAA